MFRGGQRSDPESLALSGLLFLSADTGRLERFVSLTGLNPDEFHLMVSAGRRLSDRGRELLGGVLDFLLEDEKLLLSFVEQEGIDPSSVLHARHFLPGAHPFE